MMHMLWYYCYTFDTSLLADDPATVDFSINKASLRMNKSSIDVDRLKR